MPNQSFLFLFIIPKNTLLASVCLLLLPWTACTTGKTHEYSDAEVSPHRSRFTALCSYRHFQPDYDINGHTVVACPPVIERESEWFGLSGPVSEVASGFESYRFDREGRLQHISHTLFSAQETDVQRDGSTLRFFLRDSTYEIFLDESHRIRAWTKRCARNCRMGLASLGSGKESDYHYPAGTLTEKATYEYRPGPVLVINLEEFDVFGATAARPGASFRLKQDSFSMSPDGLVTMVVRDRIGPPGSHIYENRSTWLVSPIGHRRSMSLDRRSVEMDLILDHYGNWIESRERKEKGGKDPFQSRRKISYYADTKD